MNEHSPCDEDRMLLIGLGCFLAFEAVMIAVIVWAVGASATMALGMIAFTLGLLVSICFAITRLLWVPWQRRYPAQPIEPDAVTRRWESFVFGYLGGFNHCLSISADSQHLHLHPFAPFKWCGARRMSLPWNRMSEVKPSLFGTMSSARIEGRRIAGPAWAMKLASIEPTDL